MKLSLSLSLSGFVKSVVPFVGALDDYSALTTGAWSVVRRLLTSYTGNLIRVRRVSDNVEQNFGPLASGRLDVASILTFLGVSPGVVTTVYDQFGSNNWTQSTAAMQPDWVQAVSQFNNAPAMYAGAGDGMVCSLSLSRPYSILLTECNPTANGLRTIDSNGGNRFISSSRVDAGQAYDSGPIAPPVNLSSAVCEVLSAPTSGFHAFYSNGTDVSVGNSTNSTNWGLMRIGASGVWGESARSNIAEIVTFNTNLSGGQVTALQAIFNPATL